MTKELWFAYLLGIIAGILISFIIQVCKKPHGKFVVNTTDPNKDVFMLEFDIPLFAVQELQILRLKVVNQSAVRENNNDYNG